MASIRTNKMIEGVSGKIGMLMFRTHQGKTYLSAAPDKPDKKKETAAQRNTRSTFKEATQWAQRILQAPEKKAYYSQRAKALKLPNAYTAAITDYMRKPKTVVRASKQQGSITVSKPGFVLQDVTVKTTDESMPQPTVSIRKDNTGWQIYFKKPIHDSELVLTLMITDNTNQLRRMQLLV